MRQQNGWRAFIIWWFSRRKFCILWVKIPRKKTKMERKSPEEFPDSFLWINENFSLWNCVSRNSTLFSSRRIRGLGLFWTNRRILVFSQPFHLIKTFFPSSFKESHSILELTARTWAQWLIFSKILWMVWARLYSNFTRNLRKLSCRAPLNSEPLSLCSTRSEGVHSLCVIL